MSARLTVASGRRGTRATWAWLAADVAGVGLFALVGRMSHAEGLDLAGWAGTAAPFVAGVLAGWALLALARRPGGSLAGGTAVWVTTVAGGMAVRSLTGAGTAASFVVVATVVLGALIVGSRLGARMLVRARGRGAARA